MLAMVATVVHPKYTLNGTPTSHRSRQVNPAAAGAGRQQEDRNDQEHTLRHELTLAFGCAAPSRKSRGVQGL